MTPEVPKEWLEPVADVLVMDKEEEMKSMKAEFDKLEQKEKELEKNEKL